MTERLYTHDELATADGRDGRPALIAYRGVVYDVSENRLWRGGRHFRRHRAGTDLSGALKKAPHGTVLLKRVSKVGVLDPP